MVLEGTHSGHNGIKDHDKDNDPFLALHRTTPTEVGSLVFFFFCFLQPKLGGRTSDSFNDNKEIREREREKKPPHERLISKGTDESESGTVSR